MNGCGGGGGDVQMPDNRFDVSPPRQRPVRLPDLPNLRPEDVAHAPVVQVGIDNPDGGRLYIGSEVNPPTNLPAQVVEHGDATISHGHVRDGYVRDSILGGDLAYYLFLDSVASDSPMRFGPESPVIRIYGEATEEMVSDLILTIQQINTALPDSWQIQFTTEPWLAGGVPHGSIAVNFRPDIDTPGIAHSTPHQGQIASSHVIIQPHFWTDNQREHGRHVLAHELLHALGRGHADPKKFPNTVMHRNVPVEVLSGHVLHPLDRDALMAIYSRTEYPDFWLNDWSDTSMHVRGDFNDVAFGVASRNGFIQPWATGAHPWDQLADNPALSGNAFWNGRLIGLTPTDNAVGGEVGLSVNLANLSGQLDFTSLEYWLTGAIPGHVGSGLLWGDGDLAYTVDVRGNTFVQAGGDEGVVTGAFFGESHEEMGGVLERDDLTAAFGGSR